MARSRIGTLTFASAPIEGLDGADPSGVLSVISSDIQKSGNYLVSEIISMNSPWEEGYHLHEDLLKKMLHYTAEKATNT